MLGGTHGTPLEHPAGNLISTQEVVRHVWEKLVEMVINPGPFTQHDKTDRLSSIVNLACQLFPEGPPRSGYGWIRSKDCSAQDYCNLVLLLFQKTLQCPISSRWYTVGKGDAYLFLFEAFSLTKFAINSKTPDLKFWPGDEVVVEEDQQEYKGKRRARFQKVLDFISSPEYVPMLASTVATAQARWMFSRNTQWGKGGNPDKAKGVAFALDTLLVDYGNLLQCGDIATNYIIESMSEPSISRLSIWNCIARSALYLEEKNRPFCSDFWKVIRGKGRAKTFLKKLDINKCCTETGTTAKLAQVVCSNVNGSAERMMEETCAASTMETLSAKHCDKGGADSTKTERLFSEGRALGQRMPYSRKVHQSQHILFCGFFFSMLTWVHYYVGPMGKCTFARELGIRFYNGQQQQWFVNLISTVYGCLANAKHMQHHKRSVWNAFNVFAQSCHGSFVEIYQQWRRLPLQQREQFVDLAVELTMDYRQRKMLFDYKYQMCSNRSGSLGSRDRRVPIDFDEAQTLLRQEDSELSTMWKENNLRNWIKNED